jgi:HK97 family phage major capsid protein/HK97 family phage prohead protease
MIVHKTIAGDGGGLEFVLSDATVDRYGDIVDPAGWDLRNFKKNPIALFGHSSSFPIGTWADLRVEGGKLIGRLKLASKGTSARIDELISLVEQGILRAVSVGFRPMEAEPIDKGQPYGAQRYKKQELLETSLVSVPANPAAIALAKSLNVSTEIISLAFGENATVKPRDMATTGEQADTTSADPVRTRAVPRTQTKAPIMKTLSQRIEDAQNELVAKRDKAVELNAADDLDLDAIEALTDEIDLAERTIKALKASEAKIGVNAASVAAPAVQRRPLGVAGKEVKGVDLIVRAITARGISHFTGKEIEKVLDDRYPGHEATAIIAKADQTIGTTTVSGWASEIVQTAYADFLQALMPYSVYPALRDRGIGLSFDGIGTVSIPSRTAGGAGGGFVAEGSPIRVGRITTAATTMTPKKLGVIVPFSRELAKRSTPAIEALVRQAILEDTGVVLDAALLDATASSTARPAGLLNGVSAVASGYGGGDYAAVVADLKALLAPFYAANAGDNITLIMNPAQGLALSLMPGPGAAGEFGWAEPLMRRLTIIESTNVTAGRIIAIRNSDFATALGDAPEFDISEQATVHMEDTTPLELVSAAGTVADPTRSFFQTATIGVRMLMDVSWKMRRTGMVQWIDGTSW